MNRGVLGKRVMLIHQFVIGKSMQTVVISMCCAKVHIDFKFANSYEIK